MPHVALNWDAHRIRLVAGAGGKVAAGRIRVDRAETVLLDAGSGEHGGIALTPTQLADKLQAVLARFGVSRGDATVVVSRSDVEIRELQVPPVPVDELPELVRFQARNLFTSFHDDWLLDFVPLSESSVLATALSGEKAHAIRETVERAGLKLKHIVLRPFAAAEFLRGADTGSRTRLIVEPLLRQADISVVRNDFVVMTRTVRVPETYTDEQFDLWLPEEIRRTIVAASNQVDSSPPSEIVVCGSQKLHEKLSRELQSSFDIPTTFFDPFGDVATSAGFVKPDRVDGYCSLLGSLLQTTDSANHSIDFLAPRKKKEPQLDRKKLGIAAGVAAMLLVVLGGWVWWTFSSRNAEIARLRQENSELEEQLGQLELQAGRIGKIDSWRAGAINWLDELYKISQVFPDPEHSRLNHLSGSVQLDKAEINFKGDLESLAFVESLENSLTNVPYKVMPGNATPVTRDDSKLKVYVDRTINLGFLDVNQAGVVLPSLTAKPDADKQAAPDPAGVNKSVGETAEPDAKKGGAGN
jgi:Tfp pilus assembly PilM family ATPase